MTVIDFLEHFCSDTKADFMLSKVSKMAIYFSFEQIEHEFNSLVIW